MSDLSEAVGVVFPPKRAKSGKLRAISVKRAYVPVSDSPRDNLKQLVSRHKGYTRKAVAMNAMAGDRTNRVTGEKIKSDLPEDVKSEMKKVASHLKLEATRVAGDMKKELKNIPLYTEFLDKVFGCGPVVASYLISEIDIHRAIKSSAIRKYCGFAVVNGKLDRRQKNVKMGYNAELRTRIFQMFQSMWKTKGTGSSKYLDVWKNAKHREIQKLTIAGAVVKEDGKIEGQGAAHNKGWHKAADVFLEDLYIVWRAMEGLPVWPSYYAAKLGYEHGGKISVNAPKNLTVVEALDLVGFVGKIGGLQDEPIEVSDDEDLIAAE